MVAVFDLLTFPAFKVKIINHLETIFCVTKAKFVPEKQNLVKL